jgi:hypothetical protein
MLLRDQAVGGAGLQGAPPKESGVPDLECRGDGRMVCKACFLVKLRRWPCSGFQ